MKRKEDIGPECYDLLKDLYVFQFEMHKSERIAIGNNIFQDATRVLGLFMTSYKIGTDKHELSDKIKTINEMMAVFSGLVAQIRIAIDLKLYKSDLAKNKIKEHIAIIDEGMQKWRSYVSALRQERYLNDSVSP